jgi:hypothetical protein
MRCLKCKSPQSALWIVRFLISSALRRALPCPHCGALLRGNSVGARVALLTAPVTLIQFVLYLSDNPILESAPRLWITAGFLSALIAASAYVFVILKLGDKAAT